MSSFETYVQNLLVTNQVTDTELAKAVQLLKLYAPVFRQSVERLGELSQECYASRRQSVVDFLNLAIDYDHDKDCRHIAERLELTGQAMPFFEIMEITLLRVRDDPLHGDLYYRILRFRYFDCFCKTNEDAFLSANIAPATFYRHIKKAQRAFAAILWHIVIPDFVLAYGQKGEGSPDLSPSTGTAMRVG